MLIFGLFPNHALNVTIPTILTDTLKKVDSTIADNRKARHDYFFEEQLEAGIELQGWEVKSLRAGKAQISDSYVIFKRGEAFLLNAIITPLLTASTHIVPESARTRKLLLHQREIMRLQGSREREGYTLVPLKMYWKGNKVKILIALAKGKKEFDKRATKKERDWQRQKQQVMKRHTLI